MFSILQPHAQSIEEIIYISNGIFYTYHSPNFGRISCQTETIESARMICSKMILEKNSSLPELEKVAGIQYYR